MSPLAGLLRDVVEVLAGTREPFALVGGLAVSARTEPRFTRDVDLVVAVTGDRGAEAVVRALAPPYEVLATLFEPCCRSRVPTTLSLPHRLSA